MRLLLGLSIFICGAFSFKSEPFSISFTPKFGSEVLVQGKNYFLPSINDSVTIETFKFYISDIRYMKNHRIVHWDTNGYYLMDFENKLKISYNINIPDFNEISFNIGIDSTTNSGGVKGGDLDPTKNMYWAWQSGYINFKLEGKSKVCKTRNNIFQFHIGGYSYPNNSLQKIWIPIKKTRSINFNFDLKKLLTQIGLQETNEIMSPNAKAMKIAELYGTIIEVQ